MFAEIAGDDAEDLIVLHDALDFGHCHLALGVPMGGRFAHIDSLEQLQVRQWRRCCGMGTRELVQAAVS